MKKALVLILTVAALLFAPGLQNTSASAPDGDGFPESVLPPHFQD